MHKTCIMARVHGRVQGVGFRYYTQVKARELGLYGWVKNLPDGSVEACLCGDQPALQIMQDWLAHGPTSARVTAITYLSGDCAEPLQDFSIR